MPLSKVGVGSRTIFTLATAVRSDEIDADRARLVDTLDDPFSIEARAHNKWDAPIIVRSFPFPPTVHGDVVYFLLVVPVELGVYATRRSGEGLLFLCGGFSCCSLEQGLEAFFICSISTIHGVASLGRFRVPHRGP